MHIITTHPLFIYWALRIQNGCIFTLRGFRVGVDGIPDFLAIQNLC